MRVFGYIAAAVIVAWGVFVAALLVFYAPGVWRGLAVLALLGAWAAAVIVVPRRRAQGPPPHSHRAPRLPRTPPARSYEAMRADWGNGYTRLGPPAARASEARTGPPGSMNLDDDMSEDEWLAYGWQTATEHMAAETTAFWDGLTGVDHANSGAGGAHGAKELLFNGHTEGCLDPDRPHTVCPEDGGADLEAIAPGAPSGFLAAGPGSFPPPLLPGTGDQDEDELAPPCGNCGSRIRYACFDGCPGRAEPGEILPVKAELISEMRERLAHTWDQFPMILNTETIAEWGARSRAEVAEWKNEPWAVRLPWDAAHPA